MNVNLKSLIGRLNDTCRGALEGAAGLCLSRTNYDVEIEHILVKLLEADDTDFKKIMTHFEINPDRLTKDVETSLNRLKTGNSRTPGLSDRLPLWIQDAWLLASVEYGAARIRSGHLVLALFANDNFGRIARDISREFNNLTTNIDSFKRDFAKIVAGSGEDREATSLSETGGVSDGAPVASGVAGKTKSLDQFTEDLTAKARAGKIDPILGRDFEVRQLIDILTRRRQNNPILTGKRAWEKLLSSKGLL